VPQQTCWRLRAVISETRAPLFYRVNSNASSRRPDHFAATGVARSAWLAVRVRAPMRLRSWRFRGMASTRVTIPLLSGSRNATTRKKAWMADKRLLRERTAFPRSCSSYSRKRRTADAAISAMPNAEGSTPVWARSNVRNNRHVSRQLTMVGGLSRLCWQRESAQKACPWGALRLLCMRVTANVGSGLAPRRRGAQQCRHSRQGPRACLWLDVPQGDREVGQ
jgi:hypothetical protein